MGREAASWEGWRPHEEGGRHGSLSLSGFRARPDVGRVGSEFANSVDSQIGTLSRQPAPLCSQGVPEGPAAPTGRSRVGLNIV